MKAATRVLVLSVALVVLSVPNASSIVILPGCRPFQKEAIVCGFQCSVYGTFAGYCNYVANPEAGCVQLVDGCASVEKHDCCQAASVF